MPRPDDTRVVSPLAAIRRRWLDDVIRASQQIAGQSLLADREEVRALLQSFADSLRPSSSPIEAVLLRSVLLDTAYRCGNALHDRLHPQRSAVCPFNPATQLIHFWHAGGRSAATAFQEWIVEFFAELDRTHPLTIAGRIAQLLNRDYKMRWSVQALSRRYRVPATVLSRAFKQEFGVSIRRHQELVRLAMAMGDLRGDKVEAVALQVGYRSKKDFYRAFKQVTGMTVTDFRNLTPDHARQIHERVQFKVLRPSRLFGMLITNANAIESSFE
jgi:AraC-like DNA-binding protein